MSGTQETSSAEAAASAPRTVGELLREGRARMNLTAADVARHLRLSLRQVEALEANDFAALPGNTIVRGFIRNYARLLQMDPAPLLSAYEASLPPEAGGAIAPRVERIEIDSRRPPRWLLRGVAMLLAVVAIPLAIYAWLRDDGDAATAPALREPAPPAAAGGAPGRLELPLPAAVPLAPASAPEPDAGTAPPEAKGGAEAPGAPASAPAAAAPAAGAPGSRLHFVFDEEAWVEVRDRHGRRIFSGLNRKGAEETLTGEGPFSLVIGNAHHVRLTYNGRPVDLAPHVKVNVARLTLE